MQSLEKRFDGNAEQVVQYTRSFGKLSTLHQFEIKTLESLDRFLEEKSPGEYFPMHRCNPTEFSEPNAFDQFCQAILRHNHSMEVKLAAKDEEIAELRKQLDYYMTHKQKETTPAIQAVIESCEQHW